MTDQQHVSPFEEIRHTTEDGGEFWSARELSVVLGYATNFRNFQPAIERAIKLCESADQAAASHFRESSILALIGSGAKRELSDYLLSRFALHLVVMCSDIQKPQIAQGLAYLSLASLDNSVRHLLMARSLGISPLSPTGLSAEERTISEIMRAFKHLISIRQFRIYRYSVDLYFPDQRIAIECDEGAHRGYSRDAENRRQQYIEEQLQCTFVRYNPDDPYFHVGDVINQIMLLVQSASLKLGVIDTGTSASALLRA